MLEPESGAGDGGGGAAGDVGLAAFGADRGVDLHVLRYHLAPFLLRFRLLAIDVFVLVRAHSRARLFGCDMGRGLEGNAGVVGPVLVFPVLAGLAAIGRLRRAGTGRGGRSRRVERGYTTGRNIELVGID